MNAQDVETYLAKEQGDQQRPIQTLARAYAALCSGTPPGYLSTSFSMNGLTIPQSNARS